MNEINSEKITQNKINKIIKKNINFEIDLSEYQIDKKIPISIDLTINLLQNQINSNNIQQPIKDEAHAFLTLLG